MNRKAPKFVKGVVISDKMNKTRIIRIQRITRHSLYGKSLRKRTKLFVHDEKNESKMGDRILAFACRPVSRHTHFRLKEILEKGVVE